MTDVKIIEWAKKCGWDNPATNMAPLYEFAKLVAQHERLMCSKFLQETINPLNPEYIDQIEEGIWND